MQDITLILEGGALRSLYTSGVLDVLMKYNVEAKRVMGVSAGALTGMNYVSKQPKRTATINIENCDNSRYIGLKALRKEKGLIGYDYLFNDIFKDKDPFDYETFKNSKQKFISVVTNCEEGKTEYVEKSNCKEDKNEIYNVVQASSSMPLCSKMVKIGNNHYLDGAVTMPERYNKIKEELNRLEKEGKIIVIAPEKPVTVSRLEKDKEKLRELYKEGTHDMEKMIDKILAL